MSKSAVDTNVLLYFLDSSAPERRLVAAKIILERPFFNSQSLSELINVLRRRWKFPKEKIIRIVDNLLNECEYLPLSGLMVTVASALEAGCEVLYSEDFNIS